jgi:hypothetical protein
MLRHRMAAALLFALQDRVDVYLGLPSVVYDEIQLHLIEKHQTAQANMMRASGEVRQILGQAREVEEHTDQEVRNAHDNRLAELSDLIKILPCTESDLADAGRMVLERKPPSSRKSQQYRDSVIWRIVANVAHEDNVYLVSNDTGFHDSSDGGTLARNLLSEISDLAGSVTLFKDVEALLLHWSAGQPSLNTEDLRQVVSDAVADAIADVMQNHGGFVVQNCISVNLEAYLTEVHDQVTVSGDFEYYLAHPDFPDAADPAAAAQVNASATVGLNGPEVLGVTLDTLKVYAITPHGDPKIADIVFVRAADGVRNIPYTLQSKLNLL